MKFQNNHFYLKVNIKGNKKDTIIECGKEKKDVFYTLHEAVEKATKEEPVMVKGVFYFFNNEKILCTFNTRSPEEMDLIRNDTRQPLLLLTEMPEGTMYAYDEELVYRQFIINKVKAGINIPHVYAVDPRAAKAAFHKMMEQDDGIEEIFESEPVCMKNSRLVLVNV